MEKLADLPTWLVVVPVATAAFLLFLVIMVKNFVHLCKPNEILIFSGRSHMLHGRKVGYRVIFGGRGFKWPIIENVQRLDMSLISVPMSVQGAYSEGGIPLAMAAVANVKVSSDPKVVGNAIERFLGRHKMEIARVAKETLEGHLRGVLAEMTPEEVNEDRLKFAAQLKDHAEPDLEKLGLQLDTLKIQHVSDERNYLESIGRKRIAEIHREAEVAESDAVREAEEAEAEAHARSEVAKTRARAAIQAKQNELRQRVAELDAEAKSVEERAKAAAEQERAEAEQELQRIRGELAQLRLAADVTIPAQVARKVRELHAAGEAAKIAADGDAQAQALGAIADAWANTEGRAMDMVVMQNLDDIFERVAAAARKLEIGEVNLVDSGDGSTMPAYMAAYPATMGRLLEEVSRTLGVDVSAVLKGTNGAQTNGASTSPNGSGGGARKTLRGDTPAVSVESERRTV